MSQERLDTVLRWITLLWVIATLLLYYRYLDECAAAP